MPVKFFWDVLAKSLIDAGFEITASWAVSTENPQNLHQAQKNAVSSTVLLVCRKRAPDAEQAWWDDVRRDVRNIVFEKAPDIEKSLTADSRPAADRIADPRRRIKPPGIDLCLTAFGSALSVFTRYSTVLDSAGNQVEPHYDTVGYPPYLNEAHAEYKVFNALTQALSEDELTLDVKGILYLYTERDMCPGCVISCEQDFKGNFPNIKIIIFSDIPHQPK